MTYVRNTWYVAAYAHEIMPERPVGVTILNEPIVIWRNAAGGLTAFEDRCIHRLAPLSLGRCEGEKLRCMYHGLLYDRTGRVVEIPGQEHISHHARVRTYPIVERHSWVWIWMGDPAVADESVIPPIVGMNMGNPDYVFGHGQLDYAAEARLITENLLDLSHVCFLHAQSFRMGETWAKVRPKVTQHERSVRSERWFKNEGPNGCLDGEVVDSYFSYDCFVPGIFAVTLRMYPAGTADAMHDEARGLSQGPDEFFSQAVTPLTDKTARYFYFVCSRRRGEETVADMASMDKGFVEDQVMIEAQQRNIDVTPGYRFTPTTADRGIMLFNRMVEKLVHEESAGLSQVPQLVSSH